MRAVAVIGAMFGDEGKGRMVDYFASQAFSLVVRSNGGGQAGHTVVDHETGQPHIFRHHGSGAFCGAPTFLSRFFISNPYIWAQERTGLVNHLGSRPVPDLFVDPASPLTTPYDMLINREMETQMGTCGKRHGTCGLGVGETVKRLVDGGPSTFVGHIGDNNVLELLLGRIRSEWVPRRIREMPGKPSIEFMENIDKRGPIDLYLKQAQAFKNNARPGTSGIFQKFDQVIFEGAQGLGLDEGHMFFPHVTRSRTGLANVAEICGAVGISELEVVYVTRAYSTRHGEGPFPTHDPDMTFDDPSNYRNDFQGEMRFGALDLDLLRENVRHDLTKAPGIKLNVSVAVTCLDQVPNSVVTKFQGKMHEMLRAEIPAAVARAAGATKIYASVSRERAGVPAA